MKMRGRRFMLTGTGLLSLWAATFAQPVAGRLVVVPGSTTKVSQLTGDVETIANISPHYSRVSEFP